MQRGIDAVAAAIARELELLEPEVRASRERCDELLDAEFTEIGASGRLWTRAEMLDAIVDFDQTRALASEFDGAELAPGLVHITWLSTSGDRTARRSSLWRWDEGGWRILFHQGTPSPPAP